jgi:AcrR family transcriptional regulator
MAHPGLMRLQHGPSAAPTERAEATRRQILSAACDVIAKAGLETVRMRMVAQRAGVSTALLHYHFANRETLFLAALRHSCAIAAEDVVAAAPAAGAEPHAWRLARAIELCLPVTPELRRDFVLWQELGLRAARDNSTAAAAAELYGERADRLAAIVLAGIEDGRFAALVSPHAAADLVIALAQGHGLALLPPKPPYTADQARDAIWAALREPLGLAVARPGVRLRAR